MLFGIKMTNLAAKIIWKILKMEMIFIQYSSASYSKLDAKVFCHNS